MSTSTPNWTGQTTAVQAQTTVAAACNQRATMDLRAKYQARLYVAVGRAGTTAITGSPLTLVVRPLHNNAARRHPANPLGRVAGSVTAVSTTINGTQNQPQTSLTLTSTTGMAVGDILCVGYNSANEEYCRVSKVTSGTVVLLDAPTIVNHANGETVTNQGESWIIPVPGGSLYEVIFDFGACSAGPTLSVSAWYETYDSDTIG
jgi:hypothetical protein